MEGSFPRRRYCAPNTGPTNNRALVRSKRALRTKNTHVYRNNVRQSARNRDYDIPMSANNSDHTTIDALSVDLVAHPAWIALKAAATALQGLQIKNGSIPAITSVAGASETDPHTAAAEHVATICSSIEQLAPHFPHDASYLAAAIADFGRWVDGGFGEPDFLASILEFAPAAHRVDGIRHLVIFPMYTQNGSTNRLVEAVLVEVLWPEFIAELEAGEYSNKMLVPLRFIDFTAGYDTNSAVLFPESVAMSSVPTFTWGALFQDREAARFRKVTRAATEITNLALPTEAEELLTDQTLAEEIFIMWDLIHDRTHMRGDLPFDPFMIKQRMPYFLYGLEEMRCDLTAFRESVKIERDSTASPELRRRAKLVQYAVIFSSPGCTSTVCCTGPTTSSPSTGRTYRMSWSHSVTLSMSSIGVRSIVPKFLTGSPPTNWLPQLSRHTPRRCGQRVPMLFLSLGRPEN